MELESRSRNITTSLLEALTDTRIVVLQGARQVGKTTLVRQVVERLGGQYVTLDDEPTRLGAEMDPEGFLAQNSDGLLAVDEVQRVPELTLTLKKLVDLDPRPGRFLLTGSADLVRLPTMRDSLAGRAENIELYGFSQGELSGVREVFVDRLLAGESFVRHTSDLHRQDYLERAVMGGYPEALKRASARRRNAWFDNYLRRIVERDASEISRLQRIGELPLLLRLLAARNACELNLSDFASEAGIPVRSLRPYVELLETLFLVHQLPAWSTNLSVRTVSKPKIALVDTGLAARLMNVSASGAGVGANPEAAGQLLEGFVVSEVRRQFTWSEQDARMFHLRTYQGAEVDIVLETADGHVAGIEVKARSAVKRKDIAGLQALAERVGSRFAGGVLLYTGTTAAQLSSGIVAAPMDLLWTSPVG